MDIGDLLKGAFGLDAQTMVKKGIQNEDIYLSDDPAVLANEGLLGFLNDQAEIKKALEREQLSKDTKDLKEFYKLHPQYSKYKGQVKSLTPDEAMAKLPPSVPSML